MGRRVIDRTHALDENTVKIGLLMESAETQQRLAETHLETLRAHTRGLDAVVREEIRRTLVDELAALSAEADRTVSALRAAARAVRMRGLLWNLAITAVCIAAPSAAARLVLPSQADIDGLRSRRDLLVREVARLEERGGRADWRRCGETARFCVRVDKEAPVYGEKADYFVVMGY